jgi:DNA-directed RNA polymerase specialized sigma24 family protein
MGSLSDNFAYADAALEPLPIDSVAADAAAITDPTYTPEQWCEVTQTQTAIQTWMQTLSDRDRRLLERLFWSDETQADIARSLQVSRAAISKHMSRITHAARVRLAPYRNSLLLQ